MYKTRLVQALFELYEKIDPQVKGEIGGMGAMMYGIMSEQVPSWLGMVDDNAELRETIAEHIMALARACEEDQATIIPVPEEELRDDQNEEH